MYVSMSSPSFALSVVRHAKENREKKMPREPLASRPQGFHAAIFPRGLFMVSLVGLSERGTTLCL